VITNNISEGFRSHGGGICIRNGSSPTLINNIVSNNSVMGTVNYGGGIYIGVNSNPLLLNNNICNNYASGNSTMGIGINIYDNSNPTLIGNIIENNHQIGYGANGGGLSIWYHDSSPLLINNVISNNSSRFGGAICYYDANPILINNTISNNTANYGSALYVSLLSSYSELTIINSILYNNQPSEIYFDSYGLNNILTVTNSIIEGGESGIVMVNNGTINWLEGNLDYNPIFENPFENDFHLQESSPAIGAGIDSIEIEGILYFSPETDIEGIPRPTPIGSMPDIGAFENLLGEPVVEVNDYQFSSFKSNISNYPNPFNPTTTIFFSIPNESNVEISIYNTKGQKVKTLTYNQYEKGSYSILWNGVDDSGNLVGSGVYLYKLIVNGKAELVRKCLLLK